MSMSRPSSVFSQIRRTSKVLVLAGVCGLALAACSGKNNKPVIATQQRPVELIYAAGANRLDTRQWVEAVQYFHEVERQYPYSEWSRRAILMTAYAHYQGNAYDDAREDADRFISLYPGNPSAAYAYYLKAVCYFEQIIDVGRDQAATEQALSALREVVRRYPTTEYATDAKLKIDMVNDQLAGKEMAVGRFYLREGDSLAAIGRFRVVVDKYQTTSDTPEALFRLVEAYLTLGLNEEAKRNAAVLGFNYPGDRWYSDAFNLMQGRGLRPQIVPVKTKRPGGIRLPSLPFMHGKALKPPATA
jgi:outer membrane protein assembly factor BamD